MTFINLHTHSEFSLLDGLGKPEQYARRAKELGQPAIAITDHGNVDGAIKWQKACKKEGIKSIIGCEIYIVPDMKIRQKEKKGHITILVKNQEGWKTLLRMLTVANLDGFYGRPRIDYDLLYENLNEGLVILTGCSGSFLTLPGGQDLFLDLVDLKMGNIYLEVMPHCIPGQEEINDLCFKLSQETGIPLVATNDCHYVLPDQWKAQEVLLAIQRKAKWSDPNRWKFGFTGLHLRSEEEMMKEFEKQGVLSKRQYLLAIMNTNRIAEQCWGFQIPQKLPELPLTKYEKNSPTETAIEILDHFCRSSFFEGQGKVNWNEEYEKRYRLEYEIIKKKDFARYFLIIYELVEWAKNNGIAIGPGRGCFLGSTKVSLLDGTERTMEDLSGDFRDRDFWVYSCLPNGKIVPGKARNPRVTKSVNKICIIQLDNKEKIYCTEDHLFLMREGNYKKSCNLIEGDSLMPLYREYSDKGYESYYDLLDEEFLFTHYMFFNHAKNFVIHHKDFFKRNNTPDNLIQMKNKEHADLHASTNSERWKDPKWRKEGIGRYWQILGSIENRTKTIERNKSLEHRAKVSAGQKRIWGDLNYRQRALQTAFGNKDPEVIEKKRLMLKERNKSQKQRDAVSRRNKDPEFVKKVSEGRKKYFKTEDGLKEAESIRKRMTGRIVKDETKQRLSLSKIGHPAWNKGKKSNQKEINVKEHLNDHPVRKRNHKVKSVKIINLSRPVKMYDIEVENYHNFALSSGVFVHNSVGGSLTALLLGITQVDPLKYGLIFERFISEDRIDLPDIDLDFDKDKADLIKKHLEEEYGEYNIAGIGTFLSMQAKAVVRDIGRVFDLPSKEVDTFAKSIKYDQKENVVEHSIETKEGKDFAERYPEQFQLACDLEGQCRGSGQHPAGLIISGQDLRETDRCNLTMREGSKVINWDMGDSEIAGLIKIDVLRLGTLTVLDEIKKTIGKDFRFEDLSFDDQKVFDFISKDSLAGIFQLTGYDCAKLCREYKIENLEDIAAIISLARPGPKGSGMTEQYVQRKKGRKWEHLHPLYEEITKETYGVVVYQEQVMKMMINLAGFSGSDADRIRKVIGKKRDVKEFEPFREAFLNGCRERNTLDENQANEFWQGLLKHANYSFNKAHAIEYAMIGYWTAWAKCCYFDEFLCASLTYGDDGDKEHLIEEAQSKGIQVVTPKVNFSDIRKWVIKDQRLYMPFTEIKGIGEKEAEKCLNIKPARQGFFTLGKTPGSESNNATQKLLTEIKAFDPDPEARPDDCSSYFQFNIGKNHKPLSPIIITKKQAIIDRNALECHACGLRQQAKQIVLSSFGIYNAAIIAEAPGCISGDTLIDTAFRDKSIYPNGIPIRDLIGVKDLFVYSFDTENKELAIGKVNKVWKTGKKPVFKVTYSWHFNTPKGPILKNDSIKVSSDHLFLLKKWQHKDPFKGVNKENSPDYLSINTGLRVGHSLQPFYRISNHDYYFIGTKSDFKVREGRFLLEYKLGRQLTQMEQCHHKNENKLDDKWDNLILINIDSHSCYHTTKNNAMHNLEIREKHKQIMQSDSYRLKQSLIMKEIIKNNPDLYNQRRDHLKSLNKRLEGKPMSPQMYYAYLQGRIKKYHWEEENIKARFLKKYPNEVYPPIDNHKIISIEYIGEEDVFDIEVEGYSNFAAQGIFIHNSKENAKGIGLIGDSGDLLWSELERHGITRRMVNVGNACKCFPSKTRTPSYQEADTCFNKWLVPEIQSMDCKLILGLGGIVYYALTGKTSGITKASGKLEWIEKIQSWVVWCIHPSFVLRKRSPENIQLFEAGIKAFAEQFEKGK